MEALARSHGWRVRGMFDNPTDYLGGRGLFSPRRINGISGRLVARATKQRVLMGMNMCVVLQPV